MKAAISTELRDRSYQMTLRLPKLSTRRIEHIMRRVRNMPEARNVWQTEDYNADRGTMSFIADVLPRELVTDHVIEVGKVSGIKQEQLLAATRQAESAKLVIPAHDAGVKRRGDGTVPTIINAVGFELEGLWLAEQFPDGRPTYRIGTDGSVHDMRSATARMEHPACHAGELRLGPYERGVFRIDQLRNVYPGHVNASCGLHVHVSFTQSGYYNLFVNREFYNWFLEGLQEWRRRQEADGAKRYSTFWERIRGNNHFCAVNYSPNIAMEQLIARQKIGSRYNALNYCKRLRGTIECRVLNAFDTPEECADAVREVSRLYAVWASHQRLPHLFLTSEGEALEDNEVPVNPWENLNVGGMYFHVPGSSSSYFIVRASNIHTVRANACSRCQGQRLVYYACGCREWCPACHDAFYACQTEHHRDDEATSGPCWRSTGYFWNPENNINVPHNMVQRNQRFLNYEDYEGICPICGRHVSEHAPEGDACPTTVVGSYFSGNLLLRR